ncbi:MAG: hypothetical protein NXI03_05685, partial [Alphaproteobacteria bacterium]|nr:hypothetical protein [Alphaproteobacteria bacterium]
RYLFEGRLEAAGEALAAHGDGTSARREAESTLFLDALQPVPAKSQPVELVIKVEHPNEERVLEGAVSGGPPPAPVEDFAPPPPPMPDRRITSRREAEAEIARILATVEAMPLEEREAMAAEDAVDSIEAALSERRDDPIEGEYHAVEAEPETPEPVEEEPAAEQSAEQPDVEPETETEPEPEASVEADVLARVAEAIDAELPAQQEADAPAPVAAEPVEATEAEPLPEGTRLGFDYVKNAPVRRRPAPRPVATPDPEPVTEPVEDAASEPVQEYVLDLPAGTPLGYAFTAVLPGRFRPQAGAQKPQQNLARAGRSSVQSAGLVPVAPQAVAPLAADTDPSEPDMTPEAEAPVEPVREAAPDPVEAEDAHTAPVTEIVERAVSVAGDDTPPPHPSDHPAESAGSVGEVMGETRNMSAKPALTGPDHDPLMEDDDPLLEEDFSPQDLASDVPPSQEKPLRRPDDGIWGFLSIFVAGCVVAGYGLAVTRGDWGWMLSERNLTIDGWATIGGVFLMLASAWPMVSAIVGRLKGNR